MPNVACLMLVSAHSVLFGKKSLLSYLVEVVGHGVASESVYLIVIIFFAKFICCVVSCGPSLSPVLMLAYVITRFRYRKVVRMMTRIFKPFVLNVIKKKLLVRRSGEGGVKKVFDLRADTDPPIKFSREPIFIGGG